ncbi:hypothetical protein SD81_028260 [Tolypothrix campylonemoides VB511288]|nr:hypothetical protein SD81_028260 [Tolypothrix campylonemoides VB511288]
MNSDLLKEWLSPSSVAYLASCLQICENAEMVADLRSFAPPKALREATKRLSPRKRQQLKDWVLLLNSSEKGVAA